MDSVCYFNVLAQSLLIKGHSKHLLIEFQDFLKDMYAFCRLSWYFSKINGKFMRKKHVKTHEHDKAIMTRNRKSCDERQQTSWLIENPQLIKTNRGRGCGGVNSFLHSIFESKQKGVPRFYVDPRLIMTSSQMSSSLMSTSHSLPFCCSSVVLSFSFCLLGK